MIHPSASTFLLSRISSFTHSPCVRHCVSGFLGRCWLLGDFNLPSLDGRSADFDPTVMLPGNVRTESECAIQDTLGVVGLHQVKMYSTDLLFCSQFDGLSVRRAAYSLRSENIHHYAVELLLECVTECRIPYFRKTNLDALNLYFSKIDWSVGVYPEISVDTVGLSVRRTPNGYGFIHPVKGAAYGKTSTLVQC